MLTTPSMGLIAWNLPGDPYNSEELAENFVKLDLHDHSSGKGVAITSAGIADQAITVAKLHPSALPDATIADGTVTLAMLASNSVNSSKIVDGSIVAADLASNAVETAKINNGAVTRAKVSAAGFIQTARAAVVAQSTVTVGWGTSFLDTNYTVLALMEPGVGGGDVKLTCTSRSATQAQFSLGASHTGTLHVVGIHD